LILLGCVAASPKPSAKAPPATRPAETIDDPSPLDQSESPDAPVPYLSGEEAIKTFQLPPGYSAQLVAQEPMVEHPVNLAFGPDGRLWVCEMRGYMPNYEAVGEQEPVGRISVLEDTDGDGRMDKSTVFLDGLVMPRAIGLARDGVLVGAPPNLWFCRDTDGDGKADEKTIITADFGDGYNPEAMPNGLMYGIDNWIYCSSWNTRLKDAGASFSKDIIPIAGQFGISQDNLGRQYFNTNSSYLRADLLPSHYTIRNPHFRGSGVNLHLYADQECWPAHPATMNRGYRAGFLRDGRLREFTAACGPAIYRDKVLGGDFENNAFVCEAAANFVRRAIVKEDGISLSAANAYDKKEFLASTYERFRPVNTYTGPDGALWVVDMHHGILQHRLSLTPYARNKYEKRRLNKHLNTGRIYRIVKDGATLHPTPRLSKAKSADLIAALSHSNGWWRDTAQRLLVERNYSGAAGPLKKLATSGENPLGRMHALWTLEGMRRLDANTVRAAFADADWRVRVTALRTAEFLLAVGRADEVVPDLLQLAGDADPQVKLQFALTVSAIGTKESDAALAIAMKDVDDRTIRDAAVTGLRSRELDFAERLLSDPAWSAPTAGHREMLVALTQATVVEAKPKRVTRLLDLAVGATDWRREAIVKGIANIAAAKPPRKPVMLDAEPAALVALFQSPEKSVQKRLETAHTMLVWPGKPGYEPPPPPQPLTASQQVRFEEGKLVYAKTCIQCHKADGLGLAGMAPPLASSEWVLGTEERMVRIILNGLRGPITVNGERWSLDMPHLAVLSDLEIAAVLTFVRRSWENTANAVEPQAVARIRTQLNGLKEAWTERELLKLDFPDERPSNMKWPTSQHVYPQPSLVKQVPRPPRQ
ncbi:MAG: PVC-type heme-binding CxxCH protein, partial [Tepidisphaeraceae bacterium]